MVSKKTLLLAALFAFAGGCLAGLAAGGVRGFRAGKSLILNSALTKDAREVEARIETLRLLWEGKHRPAIAKLEAGLDDILVAFDPSEPYPGLQPRTATALRASIGEARKYRTEHPWPATEKHVRAEMVRNLFARDLYREDATKR